MGSFFSSCSISHMRLINQKTSIQLLIPSYSTDLDGHKGMIVSNDGAQAFYCPFAFPIHGEYYDYGYLENIKEDNNTKMLEEYFNMTIEDIVKYIGRKDVPKGAKNVELYNSLSMTYFRTEVLEFLQKGWEDVDLSSSDRWSVGYSLSEFFKNYFESEEDNKSLYEFEGKDNLTDEEYKKFRTLLKASIGSKNVRTDNYIRTGSRYKNMFSLLPIDESFKDEIIKQNMFLINFGCEIGRTLIPSDYGTQENNFVKLYELNDLVNDLLIEDMKSYLVDDEDSEYESIVKKHQRNRNLRELGV